jgi:glucose-1-phosphate cytidylyltransferase
VCDVDLAQLLAFHRAHGRLATMTCVRPLCQYGVLELGEDDAVCAFREKPRLDVWANAGFFVFRREFLDQLQPSRDLEANALPELASRRGLRAFRHEGFWQCMDTWKDVSVLIQLWQKERPPWKTWPATTRAA